MARGGCCDMFLPLVTKRWNKVMRHTTNDLLLAAEVWKLACEMRDEDWRRSDEDPLSDTSEWTKAHPIGPYVAAAIKRLNEVADFIKSVP